MAGIMVVERDFLLPLAAALLEEGQLAADPQEAEEGGLERSEPVFHSEPHLNRLALASD